MELEYSSLNQAIEHYSKYETPCKFQAVTRLVAKLCDGGNKVIVWSSFVHNLTMLRKLLSAYNPVVVYGGVPYSSSDEEEVTREQLITKFKVDHECRLLIANPAACAESISLHTVCHKAVYLDRTFNCAHYMQSLDRIHRIGLEPSQKTEYFLVVARNTIDEAIQDRLKQKMLNMEHVLEDDLPGSIPGYWAGQFSDEEDIDLEMVEAHIREVAEGHAGKA
jgi:SNF2 family DNA or RNA helicase